jgi:hypothetical protein
MDEYSRLLVRKSHAWLLLARRGYKVPPQNQEFDNVKFAYFSTVSAL